MKLFIPLLTTLLLCSYAHAIDGMQKVGQADFTYLWMDVYSSVLWSNDGKYDSNKAHSLENTYDMGFTREELLDSSQTEMKRVSDASTMQISTWIQKLKKVYPAEVKKGDVIRASFDGNKTVSFFYNEAATGAIEGEAFARAFMGIWLSPKGRDQSFTKALTGR